MIFLSIGLPSRFAGWCDLLAWRLAVQALGPTELAGGNTLEEIGLAAVKSQAEHLLIGARQPSEGLRAALAAAECSFIIALDDPRAALQNLVVGHGVEWTAATRATASSCAAMVGFTLMPHALVLRAQQHGRDAIATAGAIASCLGLELDAATIAACVASLPPFGEGTEPGIEAWWASIDPKQREIAAGALMGYVDQFNGQGMGEIIWSRELFFVGDDPQQAANWVIDLAGGIRNLVFGPYIALPPGEWNSTVSLAVSKEAAGIDFGIEVIAAPRCITLARANIAPDDRGLYRTTLAFTVDASTDQPISFCIANLNPTSGGRLALGEIALTVHTTGRAEIPAELSTALGL